MYLSPKSSRIMIGIMNKYRANIDSPKKASALFESSLIFSCWPMLRFCLETSATLLKNMLDNDFDISPKGDVPILSMTRHCGT